MTTRAQSELASLRSGGPDGLRGLEVARLRRRRVWIFRRSKPAPIPNPLMALAFRIFGRREPVRFAPRA